MRFDYSKFKSDHGAMPRGYGNWGFCPFEKYDRVDYLKYVMWHTGTFSDAKKSAAAYFRDRGVDLLVVCS